MSTLQPYPLKKSSQIISIIFTLILCLPIFSYGSSTSVTVDVSSQVAWTDTGLDVKAGDFLIITASGVITLDTDGKQSTPEGRQDLGGASSGCNYLVFDTVPHALVGQIGASSSLSGSGFYVGANFSAPVNSSGRLFLGFNDGFVKCNRSGLDSGGVGDNSGSFSAKVIVIPSTSDSSVKAFVTRFYNICLGREPEQEGLNNWVNALLDGSLTGADVAYGFVFSQEFINYNYSNEEFVTILYAAFFDREPDRGGYNDWVSALKRGYSRQDVLDGFIYSTEFSNLCNSYGIKCHR